MMASIKAPVVFDAIDYLILVRFPNCIVYYQSRGWGPRLISHLLYSMPSQALRPRERQSLPQSSASKPSSSLKYVILLLLIQLTFQPPLNAPLVLENVTRLPNIRGGMVGGGKGDIEQ